MQSDFTPTRLAPALDASLRRLAFDYVDALLLHSPDEEALNAGGLAEALDAIKASGKARQVGVSCDDAPALRAALALPVLDLLELPIDLIDAAADEGLTARFPERGVTVLAREVIRRQPALEPMEAVALAASRIDVDCVIVGVSRPERLTDTVQACRRGVEARNEPGPLDG